MNDIERAMQEGEAVFDQPAITCEKVGHAWCAVCVDSRDYGPLYLERCERCGARRIL